VGHDFRGDIFYNPFYIRLLLNEKKFLLLFCSYCEHQFPIIIIIIIIIISFMQGIYTYIPDTNYVLTECSVAAILLLLFMVLISLVSVLNLLYFYISTFLSMCAVPNVAVFCSTLTSCIPGTLLTYFLNDFEIVPVAPIITGITFVFAFHMRCISTVRSLYFRIFSASFFLLGFIIIIINLWQSEIACTEVVLQKQQETQKQYLSLVQLVVSTSHRPAS